MTYELFVDAFTITHETACS